MANDMTRPSKVITTSAQPVTERRKSFLFVGGGCLLLLCVALLVGGAFFSQGQLDDLLANLTGTPGPDTDRPTPFATPTTTTETEALTVEATSAITATGEITRSEATAVSDPETPASADQTETPPVAPSIGEITFALGATEDEYEPVEPGLSFEEGITEIHAIFDYEGMSDAYTWERVWYLNGDEILRNAADWAGEETGRFDYFIDAGGEPLFPGRWRLELYVEDQLLASGNFMIEADAEDETEVAVVTPTIKTTGRATATPTPTPASVASPTAPPPAPTRSSGGGTYLLLFTRWDGGQHHLYVADTNGNNELYLLRRAAGPSWTPDKRNIFFYGEEGIDRQLVDGVEYVFDGVSNGIISMDASPLPQDMDEISLFQRLDWKQGTARWANVSPNGQMVAFDAKPGSRDYRIFFLGTEGNQQFRFEILGEQADWSPDSERVVYRSGRGGQTGLWISNRDDTGHMLLTGNGSDSFPTWSPDGETIAFSREVEGNIDIYAINVDGSNLRRLTEALGPDTLPTYTPGGDLIFRSARDGQWSIWKMSGRGDNETEIIPDANVGPDWAFSRMSVR